MKVKRNPISGALTSQNDPTGIRREAHAISYYEQLRVRGSASLVNTLSKHVTMDVADIEIAINHLLFDMHSLMGSMKRFDPSYDIAQSLQRLLDGRNIKDHDYLLIPHEALEAKYMRDGLEYNEAHAKANIQFDYERALLKWLTENDLV